MAQPLRPEQIAAADWQLRAGHVGDVVTGIDDVDQCVASILLTPKGSVAHRPTFGSDLWRYVDTPADQARPHIVRETLDALAAWEPRVEVAAVQVDVDPDRPGGLLVTIARRLRGSAGQPTPFTLAV